MLLEEVIRSFPKLKSVQLEVEKQNRQAISFYHKHGFKKVGEKIFKISSIQMPSFVMEKKI
jgi:ribosomal protein S18 acetylase RimI-like enzyme